LANNAYPSTTLKPVQTLDFILSNGMRVGATFWPKPNATGSTVAHVDLECSPAGMGAQSPMPHQTRPQSITDAAKLALQFAESEAMRVGATITTIRMVGEEFLEATDVEAITNNRFPIVSV
jgi:hypothetical protein